MSISRCTTYRELLSMQEFDDIKDYIFFTSASELLQMMGDSAVSENIPSAWNPDDIVDGLLHILYHKQKGTPVLHMIYSEAELADDPEKRQTALMWFPADNPGQFALVCAGGAYQAVASNAEAFPIAKRLNELGISAFVLRYRVGVSSTAEKAEQDLHTAIRYILANKDKFCVTDDFALFGFSAGGHLVAEYGSTNRGYIKNNLPKAAMLSLCYPALNLDHKSEVIESMVNAMLKPGWTEDDKAEFNVFKHMDATYPATFIWHTTEDAITPYDLNFTPMIEQLEANSIPYQAKSVKRGEHGLGLGSGSEAEGWLDEAVKFWQSLGRSE